jgi:phosphoribosylaminoimidazolecarboxamide formyltransferase/IMP cyclohydrolase
VSRALVSVYDKTGLSGFVHRLVAAGYEIVSSGGTASALEVEGIPVTPVSEVTGSPEILGGRVKTLHPRIHGGILARGEADDAELDANEIERFDLVVCNLYPFRETVADAHATRSDIIEKIDIGGPAMVRAAAKNHDHVAVVTSPTQYDRVASAVESGDLSPEMRTELAREAFFHTASYDAAIVSWLGDDLVLPLRKVTDLRYGENPHQPAALYAEEGLASWWSAATQHQGKEMSFNNYSDTEAAWRLVADLGEGAVAVIKHTNAAGAARDSTIRSAFDRAWAGDPLAAFGGIVAINGELDRGTAEEISGRFVEVVIAISAAPEALETLSAKENVRVFTSPLPSRRGDDYRRVEGGFLRQALDDPDLGDWGLVSERMPSAAETRDLEFAWIVAAHTKSNSIVIARDRQAVAVGAGDQSRVGAADRAVRKGGDRCDGAVAASDAFFPFRDGLDVLVDAGVTAIVEPGGSRNDQELIDAANERDVVLMFTGKRHFKH